MRCSTYDSPLGTIWMIGTGERLIGLRFDAPIGDAQSVIPGGFAEVRRWLDRYFAGRDPGFLPAMDPQGTPLQRRLWEVLRTIPYGHTTTYGALSEALLGGKKGAQAVGRALGCNPIALIIPCHRVIASDGSLSGYAYGAQRKRLLLCLEAGQSIQPPYFEKTEKEPMNQDITRKEEYEQRFPLFEKIRHDPSVEAYISEQNLAIKALGYTEHGHAHVGSVAERTRYILETLGEDDHTIDLALCAAWMHDMGNIINRVDHSQSGALMAFAILNRLEVPAQDIAPIICAIGNHDEGNGVPVSKISAALILADKSDVRRSRVQSQDRDRFDIHDRVNYSATGTDLKINREHKGIKLKLHIDTRYCDIGEYFEIFMERMRLCKRAANSLGLEFHLIINETSLI